LYIALGKQLLDKCVTCTCHRIGRVHVHAALPKVTAHYDDTRPQDPEVLLALVRSIKRM
jgi:hypothetical protein